MLGQALARAVNNDAARKAFVDDPRAYLIEAGVDENALKGLDLSVAEDTDTKLHFVIPAKIDQNKAAAGDEDYLVDLGKSITLSCGTMIERKVVPLANRLPSQNGIGDVGGSEKDSRRLATGTQG